MAIIWKRTLFLGFVLFAMGASVVAVTADHTPSESRRVRPPEVSPESEAPTAAEVARRALAIPQPTGRLEPGHGPIVPAIARPQR